MPILTVVVPKEETGKNAEMVASQSLLLRGVLPIIAYPNLIASGPPADHQNRMLEYAIEEVLPPHFLHPIITPLR